ncbi:PR domain zinc finger 8-like [Schistosoma japonicum]|nr:PR domain zinc finger 8-like [Schistosoma japonicum]
MIAEPAYLIAQTTTDRLSELPTIYADPKRLSDPIRLIEWVCNLRCARCPGEQNMELVCTNQLSQSFYRTTRRIEAGEELLIWFRRQDLQPLIIDYLSNLHISEAWLGQTLKATNPLQKDYEEYNNLNMKSLNTVNNTFTCSGCHSEFIYIYPYISHCLFKCQKQSTLQTIQWINHSTISINELPLQLTNKYSYQQTMNTLLYNNNNNTNTNTTNNNNSNSSNNYYQVNLNKLENLENITVTNDDNQLMNEKLFKQTDIQNQHYEKLSNKTIFQQTEYSIKQLNALHKKYLHKIHLNNNKLLKYTNTTTNNNNNKSNNNNTMYHLDTNSKKTKLKTTLLPLKSRNPLVEQLLQTLTIQKDADVNIHSSTLKKSSSSSLINSLSLAQNWCARCCITFRLTSDLVHHMRTCHNQSSKNINLKDRIISHHKNMLMKRKHLYNENNDNEENNELNVLHSIEQSCLSLSSSSSSSLETTVSTMSTSQTPITVISVNKSICSLCGEQFKEKHHLIRHMLSHT